MANTLNFSCGDRAQRAPQHRRLRTSCKQLQAYLLARGALRRLTHGSLLGSPPDVRLRGSPPLSAAAARTEP